MNPHLQSSNPLTPLEKSSLVCILKGIKIVEIPKELGVMPYQSKYAMSNLKRKFGAKTIGHLIALAVLDFEYFQILWKSNDVIRAKSISQNQVSIIKLHIVGFNNVEISEKLSISERTVIHNKQIFKTRTSAENHSGIIKSAIINGILSFVAFSRGKEELDPSNFDDSILKIVPNSKGYVYLDYKNRFYLNVLGKTMFQSILYYDLRILGILLSEIPEAVPLRAAAIEMDELMLSINTWQRINKKVGNFIFVQKLIDAELLHIVKRGNQHKINTPSHLIILEHIIKGSSKKSISEQNNLTLEQTDKLYEEAFNAFGCLTELTFILEALSRGLVRIG